MASVVTVSDQQFSQLRRYNVGMGLLHLVQGILVVVLATDFSLPITATYLLGPPGSTQTEQVVLLDVSLAWGVASFGEITRVTRPKPL